MTPGHALRIRTIDDVKFNRQLEYRMLDGRENDRWRIGVELGYSVAVKKLGLTDVCIASQDFADPGLWTRSGKVLLEARMIDLRKVPPDKRRSTVGDGMGRMTQKLGDALDSNPATEKGCAFLSCILDEEKRIMILVGELFRDVTGTYHQSGSSSSTE